MHTRCRVRSWMAVLGMITLALAVQPYFGDEGGTITNTAERAHVVAHPADQPGGQEAQVGWWISPLVAYRTEVTPAARPGGGYEARREADWVVGWASRSSLCLAAGVALLALRPVAAPATRGVGGPEGLGGQSAE